jgi:hypothetical protein
MEKLSRTTDPHLLDHMSYLLTSDSLTEVNTKSFTILPTLFGNPYYNSSKQAFTLVPDNPFKAEI